MKLVHGLLSFVAAALLCPDPTHGQALALKDAPDDARASIAKEKARRKSTVQQPGGDEVDVADIEAAARRRHGTSDRDQKCEMNVASPSQTAPGNRRVVVVVTKPVVQICDR